MAEDHTQSNSIYLCDPGRLQIIRLEGEPDETSVTEDRTPFAPIPFSSSSQVASNIDSPRTRSAPDQNGNIKDGDEIFLRVPDQAETTRTTMQTLIVPSGHLEALIADCFRATQMIKNKVESDRITLSVMQNMVAAVQGSLTAATIECAINQEHIAGLQLKLQALARMLSAGQTHM
ncbi:hypothetical protein NM688_g7120 [Phlebia brevispora]|uniref:Uncharacterized protein n=1 Tax=Phlebia brevispora TaxID=194682 RepID=A0ACC1S8U1_9APHY|nr:hypothetical protein NM688_g7120 [Phlebia brevispora]